MKKKFNDILSRKLFLSITGSMVAIVAVVGILAVHVFAQEDIIVENNIAPEATISADRDSWYATHGYGQDLLNNQLNDDKFYASREMANATDAIAPLIFSWEEVQMIDEIQLYPHIKNSTVYGMPQKYTISVSLNGTNYRVVKKIESDNNKNYDPRCIQFAPQSCKYVKIEIEQLGFKEGVDEEISGGKSYALLLKEVAILESTERAIITSENNIASLATIEAEVITASWGAGLQPGNLVDKTVGCNNSYSSKFSTTQTTKQLIFNYEKTYDVEEVVIYPFYEITQGLLTGFPKKFTVSVYDGAQWHIVAEEENTSTDVRAVHISVGNIACSKVKIEATELGDSQNASEPYNLQLSEIAIIGKETVVLYIQADNEQTYNIKDYWNVDEAKRIAPVKEGYVFGGWFETADESKPLTEETLKSGVPDKAYAKFVPAEVLSVKAQNESGVTEQSIAAMREKNSKGETISDDEKFYVRVMSSLDSENYTKVGFDIYLNNKKKLEGTETTKIYTGVMVEGQPQYAEDIYGGASKYLMTWRLTQIDWADNAKLIIYVRPYWVTTDGTRVNGLGKYVHIEDEYLNYINVPVNLLGGEKVIVGAVDVTSSTNEKLELVDFENGRIFKYMSYKQDGNTFKMVGNTDLDVGKYDENGETIYANLRLKKPANSTEFNVADKNNTFCNWDEEFVDVKKVWDTKYVQKVTSE